MQPGEAEAVWEEEEVEGGIEIVEECPDDDDDGTTLFYCKFLFYSIYVDFIHCYLHISDCSDDECEPDDDYEYEDGIEETVQVNRPDDGNVFLFNIYNFSIQMEVKFENLNGFANFHRLSHAINEILNICLFFFQTAMIAIHAMTVNSYFEI